MTYNLGFYNISNLNHQSMHIEIINVLDFIKNKAIYITYLNWMQI